MGNRQAQRFRQGSLGWQNKPGGADKSKQFQHIKHTGSWCQRVDFQTSQAGPGMTDHDRLLASHFGNLGKGQRINLPIGINAKRPGRGCNQGQGIGCCDPPAFGDCGNTHGTG